MILFSLRYLVIVLLSLVLSGCMLGPNFHSPAAPKVDSYTAAPPATKTISAPRAGASGKAQHFAEGEKIPAEWWKVFHSPELNALIVAGIAHSPNLAAAKATLDEAQEALKAQIGTSLFPQVTAQLGGERQLFNTSSFGTSSDSNLVGSSGSNIFNLYNASVNVSYTLDVFGAARRQIESLAAQVDYQDFELEAAYLTLTSNIVTTAISIASYRGQIKATKDLIKAEKDMLDISNKQYHYGGVSGLSVYSQVSQLALTQATLAPLEQGLVQAQYALSVLIGEFPSEDKLPKFDLDKLNLPTNLPVSLPSMLVRQRPDVRASEALLHYANAQVGVATANLFPQFTLTGLYGWESLVPSGLFNKVNNTWNWGGTMLQPIFEGGALRAKRRGAIDAYNVAAAQYKQTVLSAFQNVADTLRALQHDAQSLKAYKDAEIAALRAFKITRLQFNEGGVSYLQLLTAENQYQQAIISRVQAQAARYSDTAALFQALGGGWWNRNCCCPVDTKERRIA